DGRWRTAPFARLAASPDVVVPDGRDRWLVTTSKGVFRLDTQTHLAPIWTERHLGSLYPTSGVRFDDGEVFIGMRHFVLRLTPRGDAYVGDVLLPAKCGLKRCAC